MDLSTFNIIALIAIAFLSSMLVLALFEPGLPYKVSKSPSVPLDSQEFLRMIEALGLLRGGTGSHPRALHELLGWILERQQ